jgi:hypothetical protein
MQPISLITVVVEFSVIIKERVFLLVHLSRVGGSQFVIIIMID